MTRPGPLTEERKATHGEWEHTAELAGRLKAALHQALADRRDRAERELVTEIADLTSQQIEALDMILAKIARIVSGDPNHPDHWDDIAGYALLGKGGAP